MTKIVGPMEAGPMDTQEEWKQVVDPYGVLSEYAVSTWGRVKSLKKGREGRIMTGGEGPASRSPERRAVWLMDSFADNSRKRWVDELVALAFIGDRPMGVRLVHVNGCVWDDRVENLKWATEEDLHTVAFAPFHTPTGHKTITELREDAEAAWKVVQTAQEAAIRASMSLAYAEGMEAARKDGETS